ncbi:MAG: F0F1 ATP synthase subunit A [Sphingobacterium composti]|uniref:F0F1 ATP synthase subunit A n=1 Tax=Sphingobacterium composti TaxID=363260 RepID=UPI0013586923|nr:F0F1 ATP synthase subunit A [Sphingobacterium composti Ten et al. 2007 non Yoo et al. 2007]
MVNLKRALLFFAVIFLTVNPFAGFSQSSEVSTPEEIKAYSEHHVKDDYYFSLFSSKASGKHYGFSLPVILIDNGLKVFSSGEFHHGESVVEKDGQYYKLYHGKIYKTDAAGTITYDEHHHPTNAKPWDFSITKNVAGLFIATILLLWAFLGLAKTYKKGANTIPTGIGRVLEPLVLYVRDDIAKPNIGHRYKEFMPYLLGVFFLIFLLNLMGLTPIGFNVTGNISVTFGLAIVTFLITNLKANKDYWKHIFWMPGVPVPFKLILAPIELLGTITKPFSLMLRLFANMTAGHFVIMGFIAVIYTFQSQLTVGGSIGVSMLLTLIIFMLKLLVSFLQAFIFTMLSSLFIGMAVEEHPEHEAH